MLKQLINLVLYGNFWIACCAVAMTLQTRMLQHNRLFSVIASNNAAHSNQESALAIIKNIELDALVLFIFFATLAVYALHRIIGLFRLQNFLEEGRYKIIHQFKSHIWAYAILSVSLGAYFFFQLSFDIQLVIVLPALFSLGYIIPFVGLGQQRKLRLRDYGGLKIFLVAFVWAFVTVLLPIWNAQGIYINTNLFLLFLERFIFVFAITLPFDIRDVEVDLFNNVKTIPTIIGVSNTIYLANALLIIFMVLAWINYGRMSPFVLVALVLSGITTMWLVAHSPKRKDDYYFSGALDGTMILQTLLVCLSYWFK